MTLGQATVLIIGVGGLGCPAVSALADAGVGRLILVDDDSIEISNLHRQLLFDDADVGRDKLEVALRRLQQHPKGPTVEVRRTRLLPENARRLVGEADIVVEGADNFATKFLTADVCRLEGKPVVHGAAVRWRATAWAVGPLGLPCYRCLFEDLPDGAHVPNCAEAGVMAPVAGFAGALMADLALRVLTHDETAFRQLFTYDGRADALRLVQVEPRSDCALCGPRRTILSIEEPRYLGSECAA